jgi:hypothetical protein
MKRFIIFLGLLLASASHAFAADLVVTAANVVPGSDAVTVQGTAGATITAGQAVYFEVSSSTYKLSQNNSGTAAVRHIAGIALESASANQPMTVQTGGTVTTGATMTAGTTYYLSANAGNIAPIADVTAGHDPIIAYIATSTTVARVIGPPGDPDVTF